MLMFFSGDRGVESWGDEAESTSLHEKLPLKSISTSFG